MQIRRYVVRASLRSFASQWNCEGSALTSASTICRLLISRSREWSLTKWRRRTLVMHLAKRTLNALHQNWWTWFTFEWTPLSTSEIALRAARLYPPRGVREGKPSGLQDDASGLSLRQPGRNCREHDAASHRPRLVCVCRAYDKSVHVVLLAVVAAASSFLPGALRGGRHKKNKKERKQTSGRQVSKPSDRTFCLLACWPNCCGLAERLLIVVPVVSSFFFFSFALIVTSSAVWSSAYTV